MRPILWHALMAGAVALCMTGVLAAADAECSTQVKKTTHVDGSVTWSVICGGICESGAANDCKQKGTSSLTWCECQDGGSPGLGGCMTVMVSSESSTGVRCIKRSCSTVCEHDIIEVVNEGGAVHQYFQCICIGG